MQPAPVHKPLFKQRPGPAFQERMPLFLKLIDGFTYKICTLSCISCMPARAEGEAATTRMHSKIRLPNRKSTNAATAQPYSTERVHQIGLVHVRYTRSRLHVGALTAESIYTTSLLWTAWTCPGCEVCSSVPQVFAALPGYFDPV